MRAMIQESSTDFLQALVDHTTPPVAAQRPRRAASARPSLSPPRGPENLSNAPGHSRLAISHAAPLSAGTRARLFQSAARTICTGRPTPAAAPSISPAAYPKANVLETPCFG